MKDTLKKLHVQRNKWKGHNRNSICWAFYCVNDNKRIDVIFFQTMIFIICYTSLMLVSNIKTQAKKGLILYNTSNGIIGFKNVLSDHLKIANVFKKEVNN